MNSVTPTVKLLSSGQIKRLRRKFDLLASKLGIETQSDWYGLVGKEVRDSGGLHLLNYYFKNSLPSALKSVYPEFDWKPFLFQFMPTNYYTHLHNQREMMDWIAEQLGVEKQEDWYKINGTTVKRLGADGLFTHYYNNNFFSALQSIYPEYEWNPLLCVSIPHKTMQKVDGSFLKEAVNTIISESFWDVAESRAFSSK
jgi:hypothetical protein